jgi:hypothetical protein
MKLVVNMIINVNFIHCCLIFSSTFLFKKKGFWFLHCHFEWHLGIGMSMMMQVGEVDEMITPPPDFPRCGDYTPDVYGL